MDARALPFVGRNSSHDVSPWIERLARVGFVAKGVLYLTIGVLAALAALGNGGSSGTDSRGAMSRLYEFPLGRPLVGLIAVGLAGYAVWRIIQGITDPEHRGSDAKGIAIRIGLIGRGVIHLGLAATAARLAVWKTDVGGNGAEDGTAQALRLPGGVYLLWAIALGIGIYGLYQISRAVRAKLDKQLDLGQLAPRTRRWVIGISRFGIAARGVVFATIGVLLAYAAKSHDPREAGGIGDSMRKLFELGKWPFLTISLGVAAYGIYQFIAARYRRISVG